MDENHFHRSYCDLYSSDLQQIFDALRFLRRLGARTFQRIAAPPMRNSFLHILLSFIDRIDHSDIRMEVVLILTNWTNYEGKDGSQMFLSNGLAEKLLQLAGGTSNSIAVRAQAIWCLGNIANDNKEGREYFLKNGVLDVCSAVILECENAIPKNLMWAVASMCSDGCEHVASYSQLFLAFGRVIASDDADADSIIETCRALRNLTEKCESNAESIVQSTLDAELPSKLINLISKTKTLSISDQSILASAIHVIGNFVLWKDQHIDAVLDAGALPVLCDVLSHSDDCVAAKVCWILSNVAAGTSKHRRAILECSDLICRMILEGHHEWICVRAEATIAVCNMLKFGDDTCIRAVFNTGCLDLLCDRINDRESNFELVQWILEAFTKLFQLIPPQHKCYSSLYEQHGVEERLWQISKQLPWPVAEDEEQKFRVQCNEILLRYF